VRRRFWAEAIVGALCGLLAVVTLVSREWIEALTGWDPDHGDGSLEWVIVAVLAVAFLALTAAAGAERRRAVAVTAG
jgi:hypothetical protein